LRRTGGTRKSALFELPFEGGAIGLSGAAAEILYKESGHTLWYRTPEFLYGEPENQAEACVLRDWKHSRQNTGRPCVGRKGTVVCLPHPEQVAWVSTFV
jgi:hypothetical protein